MKFLPVKELNKLRFHYEDGTIRVGKGSDLMSRDQAIEFVENLLEMIK